MAALLTSAFSLSEIFCLLKAYQKPSALLPPDFLVLLVYFPLKEKDITAFPDKGAYNKWKETADVLNNKGFNIEVSKLLETIEYEDGWDLVDMMNYENKK